MEADAKMTPRVAMTASFRGLIDELRRGRRTCRDPEARGHPPHRRVGRPVGQGPDVRQRERLRHSGRLGRDQQPQAAGDRRRMRFLGDRGAAARRARPADRSRIRQRRTGEGEICLEDGEVDLHALPIPLFSVLDGASHDHGRRDAVARSGRARRAAERRRVQIPGQGKESDRNRHRHAQQPAPIRGQGVRQGGTAADLDQRRHASVRTHLRDLQGAGRRQRTRHRGRHARRGSQADPLPDDRPALHRRRRNRPRGGDPSDRMDAAGGPVRRVHPPDGRSPLESPGPRQGDIHAPESESTTRSTCRGRTSGLRDRSTRRRCGASWRKPESRSPRSTSLRAAAATGTP